MLASQTDQGPPRPHAKEDANPSPRSSHASPSRRSVMSCAFVATRQLMTVPTLLSATGDTPSNPRFAMRGAMGVSCSRSCSNAGPVTYVKGRRRRDYSPRPRPTPEEGTAEGIHIGASFAPSALVLFQSVLVINLGRLRRPAAPSASAWALLASQTDQGPPRPHAKRETLTRRHAQATPARQDDLS